MTRREEGRGRAARVDLASARAKVEGLDALLDFVCSVYAIGVGDVTMISRRSSPAPPPPTGRGRRRTAVEVRRTEEARVAPDLERFFDQSAAHVRLLGGDRSRGPSSAASSPKQSERGESHDFTAS